MLKPPKDGFVSNLFFAFFLGATVNSYYNIVHNSFQKRRQIFNSYAGLGGRNGHKQIANSPTKSNKRGYNQKEITNSLIKLKLNSLVQFSLNKGV